LLPLYQSQGKVNENKRLNLPMKIHCYGFATGLATSGYLLLFYIKLCRFWVGFFAAER
jgi:hypothetical protein